MKLDIVLFTTWITIFYITKTANTECTLETIYQRNTEGSVERFFCIDASPEDFVYATNLDIFPSNVSFTFEISNVTISNAYIINELQHMSQKAHDVKDISIEFSNNLTDTDAQKIIDNVVNLTSLILSGNKLKTIPNLQNSSLQFLSLAENPLNGLLGEYNLGNLKSLDIHDCNISSLGKHIFGYKLFYLDLSSNKIRSLNSSLELACRLEVLSLRDNMIETLSPSDICHASTVFLEGNPLLVVKFDFEPYYFLGYTSILTDHLGKLNNISIILNMKLNTTYEIRDVLIRDEKMLSLPAHGFEPHNRRYKYGGNSTIVIENCSVVHISDNAFSGLTKWQNLHLSNNKINTLRNHIFRNTRLSILDLSNSSIFSIEANAFYGASVEKILLNSNTITQINSNTFCNTGVKEIDLSYNNLETFEYLACENLIQKLELQFNLLNSITSLGNFENLLYLNVSHNQIEDLDPNFGWYFNKLRYLDLSDNLITTILPNTFVALEDLVVLNLENNNLSVIDPSAFAYENLKLEVLKVTYNGVLEAEQFSRLCHLIALFISNSEISLVKKRAFIGLVRLHELHIDNSVIGDIENGTFIGLTSLKDTNFIEIFRAESTLDRGMFEGLESLISLDMSGIDLIEINYKAFEGLANLNTLILTNNSIRDIAIGSFLDLETLRELYLNCNKLTKLPLGIFSGLEDLEILDLSFNPLQVIKNEVFFPLRSLVHLDMTENEIIVLEHENLIKTHKNLRYFGLAGNLFKCDYLVLLLGNLTLHEISYKPQSSSDTTAENVDGIYCVDICKFVYCPEDDQYFRKGE